MNKLIGVWLFFLASGLPAYAAAQASFQDKPLGYVRLDTNLHRNQFWLGGALPLGASRSMDLSGDLLLDGERLQADAGVAFYAGALAVLPTVGVSFNFDKDLRKFDTLVVPRVFTVVEAGPLYLESWVELDLRDQFIHHALDEFYTRDFLLFIAHEYFAIGPQYELRLGLKNGPHNHIVSQPVGGQIATRWGAARFALFVGYETAKFARGDKSGVVGRFTFVHQWQ